MAAFETMTKGKHKGKSLDEICLIDPKYVKYLKARNIKKPDPYVTVWLSLNKPKLEAMFGPEKVQEPKFGSGKYKDKTFKYVMRKNPKHFITLMNKGKIVQDNPKWFEDNREAIQKMRIKHDASYGELKLIECLTGLKIEFRYEVTLPNLPHKRFDFAFTHNEINYILEIDGSQHFKFSKHFHKTYELFQTYQATDALKMRAAMALGYRIIRIDYRELERIPFHLAKAFEQQIPIYLSDPARYTYLQGK